MKKSEIRLIIVGIASLVISIILGIITVFVFIANYTASGEFDKVTEGFDSICNSVTEVATDIRNDVEGVEIDKLKYLILIYYGVIFSIIYHIVIIFIKFIFSFFPCIFITYQNSYN